MPQLSIVIATYNGARYLKPQIQSILNQTLQDFELIIVDDVSTDETIAIIESFYDSRITIHQNKQNIGVQANFEKGLSLAKAPYIILGDQDDVWNDDKCHKLLQQIKQCKALMLYSNAQIIDAAGAGLVKTLKEYNPLVGITDFSEVFLFNSFVWGCTTIIDSQLLALAKPFHQTYFGHDWWLSFVAAKHGKLVYLDEILGSWRVHNTNFSTDKKGQRLRRRRQQQQLFAALSDRDDMPRQLQEISRHGMHALQHRLSRTLFFYKYRNAAFARYPQRKRVFMALKKIL